jgi:hypothetical protein
VIRSGRAVMAARTDFPGRTGEIVTMQVARSESADIEPIGRPGPLLDVPDHLCVSPSITIRVDRTVTEGVQTKLRRQYRVLRRRGNQHDVSLREP